MNTHGIQQNISLNYHQIIDLVRQLPDHEKLALSVFLQKETMPKSQTDEIFTHFASENVLLKDWLLPEEDEAWKNL